MNTSQLKISISAEGDSAADVLKMFGANLGVAVATASPAGEPGWVEELREAIRRVEETVEKYNACRLAAQRQTISQYEELRNCVEAIQVREIVSATPVTSADSASVSSIEAKEAEEAVAEVKAEELAAEAEAEEAAEEEVVEDEEVVEEEVVEEEVIEEEVVEEEAEEEEVVEEEVVEAEEEEEVVEEAEEEVVEEEAEEEVVEEEAEEEVVEEEATEEEEAAEEEGLEEFEYKGATYYKDSENTVYTLDENDEPVPYGIWNEAKKVVQPYKTTPVKK